MIRFLLLILVVFIANCGPSKGEFGWATTQDENKNILEREIYTVTDFKMTRVNLIFSPSDTIHYVYTFSRHPGEGSKFIVTLEKESMGFVEIELKEKTIEPETNSLKDKFIRLNPGHYRVQVVFEEEVIDNIEFDVLPEEGYTVESVDLDNDKEEQDDIIRYSR
ncbi:MAG TPA: hypothetical protein PK079_14680 [Leptospiraceae bacterium]|nr:hypothetical protein [Leptospiraceae bacterium]HMW05665.1 hypothetical protein [Leptospiraceae bacterium]HMX34834.1 hypothetical protein [Leptospiraceae bacterium]HMY30302.1 hypothetical protein [Leptospiraceae bacterium]HMZ63655.1 hypothetical protein [Leptospiraceae bacterium]